MSQLARSVTRRVFQGSVGSLLDSSQNNLQTKSALRYELSYSAAFPKVR